MSDKKYNVIYADCPWSYDNKKTGGTMNSGALNKYSTMTNEDISNMPVKSLTQESAICFLWVTVPLLIEGFNTLNKWGFEYKTMLTWHKINSWGMGFWFRGQTEHLLIGIKGKVKPFRQQLPNYWQTGYEPNCDIVYKLKSGRHSQKPERFREMINDAVKVSFDNPVKLELFARSREGFFPDYEYEGWDVFGNQVNNSITI